MDDFCAIEVSNISFSSKESRLNALIEVVMRKESGKTIKVMVDRHITRNCLVQHVIDHALIEAQRTGVKSGADLDGWEPDNVSSEATNALIKSPKSYGNVRMFDPGKKKPPK